LIEEYYNSLNKKYAKMVVSYVDVKSCFQQIVISHIELNVLSLVFNGE
jgi:hypothetical protein